MKDNQTTPQNEDDLMMVEELKKVRDDINRQIGKSIVGQKQVIDQLLLSIFSGGHSLLVGVPGLAKTMIIRTLAGCLSLDFQRIQFTPDLMPSDITGTEVIQQDTSSLERRLVFMPGPVFANIILADEINRTPPKTQAALLEAMQEGQVTSGGQRHELPKPFFVLATQNPIEQEGTYPLPEAQLDRFMFQIHVDYPSEEEELAIVLQTTGDIEQSVEPIFSAERILEFQKLVRRVPIAEHAALAAVQLVRQTRPGAPEAPALIDRYVAWGAGPRASRYLAIGAKAIAVLEGRFCATLDDIHRVALPVLRHRVLPNFNAEADGLSSDDIIGFLLPK